jgi:hypothetical protein
MAEEEVNAEQQRLAAQRQDKERWQLWGPYLAERAWGTVREDYSPWGTAWEYFDHDQARSRAYRWSEDGMAGICDEQQRLCLALALWNGRDPILKERAFGLTGNQGNHGEDVKEYYFYLDAVPSHSWLRYLYKYPQAEYPYAGIVKENARRDRTQSTFSLLDTGVFDDNRYWDVEVQYAKATPEQIHMRIVIYNRSLEEATLHILPSLWFRNTWSWGDKGEKPRLQGISAPTGAQWAVQTSHPSLGSYFLYGREAAQGLFTENETNARRLWNQLNTSPWVKDAFHRYVIQGEGAAINRAEEGTKFAAWYQLTVKGGQKASIELVLSAWPLDTPFVKTAEIFTRRQAEADAFFRDLLPKNTGTEDQQIMRQALAGMIWNKQFFHYDVARWLKGDQSHPPESRKQGRNRRWRHFKAADVLSVPDCWEFPWFAAWDLAFHCGALALVDVDFAKRQIELLLREDYLHSNGQIPAYEWSFEDVNPPIHATAALKVFRAERVQRGRGDLGFLQRVLHKLLLYYAWWLNRKDSEGDGLFEGGFLGLDNISVYDRSQPLPPGYRLKQADATGWMAMFALNLTAMALEITTENPNYEGIAIECYSQFLSIANVIAGHADGPSLWDDKDKFFKDLILEPSGQYQRIDVFSWVGLIPLFACEVIDHRLLAKAPRFQAILEKHSGGLFDGHIICACPTSTNDRGEHLLSLIDHTMLSPLLQRILNEEEFLSPHGIRSVSRIHATHRDLGVLPGLGKALIEYDPGEAKSYLFGGNSNWRGPVWMPTNYYLIQALEKYHRYLGDNFRVPVPCCEGQELTLEEISHLLAERLANIFRRSPQGDRPLFPLHSPFQRDPHWQDLLQFFEYFHGETGEGLGAAHQTGWTGLVANLIMRRYRQDIPLFWRKQAARQDSEWKG